MYTAVHSQKRVIPSLRRAAPARGTQVRAIALALSAVFGSAWLSAPAHAGPFVLATGNTTAVQTLGSGSGQTGSISKGASLTVSGSNVAVTISGNNATLDNQGTISQTGTGRVVRDNTGVTGLLINNGSITNSTASMVAADADVIQMNKSPASVTLNNYGTMTSLNASKGGAQVVDFAAIQSGANVVNNYATGVIQAQDADAVRPGVNGEVNNYGKIISTNPQGDTGSDGIDAQNNTGVKIFNDTGASVTGARHGITGGQLDANTSFTTTITNNGTITGSNGSGVNIDGFNAKQTTTIVNGGLIVGNGVTGDGDGVDVDGVVNITNTGIIRSANAVGSASEGISAGGGKIVNSGTIEGLVAAGNTTATGRGITLAGNDITSGPLAGTREAIYADTTITNQAGGTIRGQSDSAIYVDGPASGFTVTINNNAGAKILGGGTVNAAIRTGADNDTVVNAGTIDGSSSGKAIDLGAGKNALYIQGGSAVILGSINGGAGSNSTMTIDPGKGQAFSYAGSISNFNKVEVISGTVTLSGQSSYVGVTQLSDGTLILDGTNRLAADSSLDLHGGTLELINTAGKVGQTFALLDLTGDSIIDLNGSALTFGGLGTVLGGAHLSILDFLSTTDLDFAIRFVGDLTSNADFLALIGNLHVDGRSAGYRFDGAFTEVFDVPEPGAALLVLQALAIAGLVIRRRRKQA